MRFRTRQSPPSYLSRRMQLRLLMMVGTLSLVLIGVQLTANPDFWRRTGLFPDHAAPTEEAAASAQVEPDFDVQLDEDGALPPGAFRSRTLATGDAEPSASEPKEATVRPAKTPSNDDAATAVRTGVDFPIDSSRLQVIRDNTLGIRSEEADLYYAILAALKKVPPAEIERAGNDEVGFRVVMVDSEEFRGKPITIEGDLRQLNRLPVPPDSLVETHGVEQLYEAWIFTADSGTNPWRIVALEIPDDVPLGQELESPPRVRVTGYFFKREGYASRGGLHTAPVLLAKRIRTLAPPTAATAADPRLANWFLAGVLAIGAVLGVGAWRFTRRDRKSQRRHLSRQTAASPEAIDALKDIEAVEPGEALRRLAEAEQAEDGRERP